jgi:hypothetical protein
MLISPWIALLISLTSSWEAPWVLAEVWTGSNMLLLVALSVPSTFWKAVWWKFLGSSGVISLHQVQVSKAEVIEWVKYLVKNYLLVILPKVENCVWLLKYCAQVNTYLLKIFFNAVVKYIFTLTVCFSPNLTSGLFNLSQILFVYFSPWL